MKNEWVLKPTRPCQDCGVAVPIPDTLYCQECIQKALRAARESLTYEGYKAIVAFIGHPKFVRIVKYDDHFMAYWIGGMARGFTPGNACEKALAIMQKEDRDGAAFQTVQEVSQGKP